MIHPLVLVRDAALAAALVVAVAWPLGFGPDVATGAALGLLNLGAWVYAARGLLLGGNAAFRLLGKAALGVAMAVVLSRFTPVLPVVTGFFFPLLLATLVRGVVGMPAAVRTP